MDRKTKMERGLQDILRLGWVLGSASACIPRAAQGLQNGAATNPNSDTLEVAAATHQIALRFPNTLATKSCMSSHSYCLKHRCKKAALKAATPSALRRRFPRQLRLE